MYYRQKYFCLECVSDSPHLFTLSEADLLYELAWLVEPLEDASRGGEVANRRELRNFHKASRGKRSVPRTAHMPPPEEWAMVLPGPPVC